MLDIHDLDSVRAWAVTAHGDQRYGDHPYSVHLDAVHRTAKEFAIIDPVVLASTYLHDVLEDTEIDRAGLGHLFGHDVAEVVWAVTNERFAPDGSPLTDRKQRGVCTYPKIASRPRARLVKLADRIANVRQSHKNSPPMLQKYQTEYPAFRSSIRPGSPSGVEAVMWRHLDELLPL